MNEIWFGVTYPGILDNQFAQLLWRVVFCPRGWHLFDESLSTECHTFFCDACELSVDLQLQWHHIEGNPATVDVSDPDALAERLAELTGQRWYYEGMESEIEY